jgi:hypothetical protein
MSNLPVQTLEFNEIQSNFINWMKNQSKYNGYSFDGSNMKILLDLFSYFTYYNGFYAHQLANESHLDSATLKSSAISKAKFKNYIAKSTYSAIATIRLKVDINESNEPLDKKIIIDRGTTFRSNNIDTDSRSFVVLDDIFIYNTSDIPGVYRYFSDEVEIYEGQYKSFRFIADSSIDRQRFIIKDKNIDIRTLKVNVYDNDTSLNYDTYTLPKNYMKVTKNSPVYLMSINELGYYELFFGDGVYGKKLSNGNFIVCSYVKSSGIDGNNAKSFVLEDDYTWSGNPYMISVETLVKSEGGMAEETLADMKFNIPHAYKRQNRTFLPDDYKTLILEEFRNVNSINVWGGEDNIPKEYGKVFISIKPKFGEQLSDYTKKHIENNILKGYAIPARIVEFVNPDFLYINLDFEVKYNPLLTSRHFGEMKTIIDSTIKLYDEEYLNKFDAYYSNSLLNNKIVESERSILSSESKVKLEKRLTVLLDSNELYTVDFMNQLVPNTLKTNTFIFRTFTCYAYDDGLGNILVKYLEPVSNEWRVFDEDYFGTINYMKGYIEFSSLIVSSIEDDLLKVTVTPYNQDFFTERNNILTINNISITLREKSANIEHKK